MKDYLVTEVAGKEVAGKPNPGAGEAIRLSDLQAEQPLRQGHIVAKPEKPSGSAAAQPSGRRGSSKRK
ncbi:hypothetical protein [Hoeflea sp.]|uniref:hypothetical protein n=1 Tax=Hoeflea sp. TaxID=1940281 RepID=UPI003B527B52